MTYHILRDTHAAPAHIDIICPTHNRSAAIRSTIDSVFAQTVTDWRLIVVSDGSSDDTEAQVLAYDDPRVTVLRCDRHGHPGGPRNIGLAHADAPYTAYIDHDDEWTPDHLATLLHVLSEGADIVATGCVRVSPEGKRTPTDIIDMVWHPELQTLTGLNEPSRVGHIGDLPLRVGGWSTEEFGFEDWDLWWRLAEHGYRFSTVPDHTVLMLQSKGTRRETITARYQVLITEVPDADVATSVLEQLDTPEERTRMHAYCRTDLIDWHRRMAESSDYVLPRGAVLEEVLSGLVARVRRMSPGDGYAAMFAAPCGDRYGLHLPLWCADRSHAARIAQLSAERDLRQRARLQGLIRECIARVGQREVFGVTG